MNPTSVKALAALLPICGLLGWTAVTYFRERSVAPLLQLAGAACLLIVVLTHVAEGFHWIPWMHWGEERSAGHYLDLSSATAGVSLLLLGVVFRTRDRA